MRKTCGLFLIVGLIAVPAIAIAEQPRVYRMGLILLTPPDRPYIKSLRYGLREAGYIEGKNLRLDILRRGSMDDLRSLVKSEIEKFDVVVSQGTAGTMIAKEATEKIPIVFILTSAPVKMGFVKSLARPGTNLTGLSYEPIRPGTIGKQLEIFKEAVPTLRRVALLYDQAHDNAYRDLNVAEAREVSVRLGIDLVEKPVMSVNEAEQEVASLSKGIADGLAMICTAIMVGSKKIGTIARQKKIAYLGCSPDYVTEQGALLAYGPDMDWYGRRAAWYVDQVLQGAKPQDLPVEGPNKFELAIDIKTAKEIGLEIPSELLIRADKVVQ